MKLVFIFISMNKFKETNHPCVYVTTIIDQLDNVNIIYYSQVKTSSWEQSGPCACVCQDEWLGFPRGQ